VARQSASICVAVCGAVAAIDAKHRQPQTALADGVELDRLGEPQLRDVGADERRRAGGADGRRRTIVLGDAPERRQERVVRSGALATQLALGQTELGGDALGRLAVDLAAQQSCVHPPQARTIAIVLGVGVQRAERLAHEPADTFERSTIFLGRAPARARRRAEVAGRERLRRSSRASSRLRSRCREAQ